MSNMVSKMVHNMKTPSSIEKFKVWGLPPSAMYINRSVTKKFQIEILLEMIDFGIKTLGEVKYDK